MPSPTRSRGPRRGLRLRPGGRSANVRAAIRRATLELLSVEGFAGVTLPAVARRAGVNKTTIYRWWASPSELLHEVTAEFEALALPDLDTGSFAGDVEAFVESRLRMIRDPRAAGILRAVVAVGGSDPTLLAWVDAFWKPRREEWRSPIERAIERGELAASAREVPLVELVAGPLLLTHLATRRRLTRRDLRAIASVVVAGVVALHGRRRVRAADPRRALRRASPRP